VQAAKAGLLEIADVFVINKADRPGTREAVRELRQMLAMSEPDWKPEIVQTVAIKGEGIEQLWRAIEAHRHYQESNGLLDKRRRRRIAREIRDIVAERMAGRVEREQGSLLEELTDEVTARRLDPYRAADRLIDSMQRA
jgi:LAO/AO transport system kinase